MTPSLTDVGGGGAAIVSKSPKFSSLHVEERTLQDCDPEDPTPIKESYPGKGIGVHKK